MKSLLLVLTVMVAGLVSGPAQANQWCGTKVTNLLINDAGLVYVYLTLRADYVAICSINTTWKNISPTTCASWISLVRSAVARKSDMIFFYNEATPCTEIPSYSNAPTPGYIMLRD
jgi:hypothetical protein